MTNKQIVQLENYLHVKKIKSSVYPVTLVKYLLNKNIILFNLNQKGDYNSKYSPYKIDNVDCPICSENKICRKHYSINRIINVGKDTILRDPETNFYFYKNEIFSIQDENRLNIIYCPHTKLIKGKLEKNKIKLIFPFTVIDDGIRNLKFPNIVDFDFKYLKDKALKIWFNDEFTIQIEKAKHSYKWCFIVNK